MLNFYTIWLDQQNEQIFQCAVWTKQMGLKMDKTITSIVYKTVILLADTNTGG